MFCGPASKATYANALFDQVVFVIVFVPFSSSPSDLSLRCYSLLYAADLGPPGCPGLLAP